MSKDTASEPQAAVIEERERLQAALQANPKDAAAHYKLAQLEARLCLSEANGGNLEAVIERLESTLTCLPEDKHPQIAHFARQLQQRGLDIASRLKTGAAPLLLACLRAATPSPAATTPSPAPSTAPTPSAPPPAPKSGGVKFKEVEITDTSNATIKQWLDGGKTPELASAYPMVESHSTRRRIIDRISEAASPMSLAALVHVLAHEDDSSSINYVMKKIVAFDDALLDAELSYDPSDKKHKAVVVQIMSTRKSEASVAPLSLALSDPEPDIRITSIQGLKQMVGDDEDWIKQLGHIARRDRDGRVRFEAVKTMGEIGPPALHELETLAKASDFDAQMSQIVDKVRAQFEANLREQQKGSRAKDKEARGASMLEKEKRGFFKITGDQIGKLVLALALLGAAIYIGKRTVEKATPQSFVNPTDAEIIEAYGMDPEQYRLIREFEAEQERQRWAQEEAEALGLPPPPPPQ